MNCVGEAMFAIASGEMKPDALRPEKELPAAVPSSEESEEPRFDEAIEEIVTITTLCNEVVIPRTIGAMKSVIVFIVPVTSETSTFKELFTFSAFCSCIESEMRVRAATFTPSCTESTSIFIEPFIIVEGILETEPATGSNTALSSGIPRRFMLSRVLAKTVLEIFCSGKNSVTCFIASSTGLFSPILDAST